MSAYLLRPATPSERRELDGATYREWGSRLTPEQYLQREERLRVSRFARESMVTWVLVPRSSRDEGTGERVLASCESFAVPSRIARSGAAPETGTAYGVASVFVDPALRGRGLATALLRELCDELARRQAQAVFLFSDIGDRLYGKLGLQPVPARSRVWQPHDPSTAGGAVDSDLTPPPAGADLLGPAELPRLLEHISADPLANRGALRVLPALAHVEWLIERAAFYAQVLGRRPPRLVAAQKGNAAAIFAPDYPRERLLILCIRPGPEADTGAVIEAARLEALRMGLHLVEAWEPEALSGRLPGGELRVRRDALPMIRPFVPGVSAADWIDAVRALWL